MFTLPSPSLNMKNFSLFFAAGTSFYATIFSNLTLGLLHCPRKAQQPRFQINLFFREICGGEVFCTVGGPIRQELPLVLRQFIARKFGNTLFHFRRCFGRRLKTWNNCELYKDEKTLPK